jgi:hypothetical protein
VDQLQHEVVLPDAEPVERLGVGGIGRRPERQVDTPRLQERAHAVEPRLAVDVLLVILGHRELMKWLAASVGAAAQVLVEHLLPRLGVNLRGLSEHTVQVEQACGDVLGQVEHAGKLPAKCGKRKARGPA